MRLVEVCMYDGLKRWSNLPSLRLQRVHDNCSQKYFLQGKENEKMLVSNSLGRRYQIRDRERWVYKLNRSTYIYLINPKAV